jgi:hypothetical protein
MARAMSSFPVPLSPRMRMVESPARLSPEVDVLLLYPRQLERPVHEMDDLHHLERLRDVVERPKPHRLDGVLHRSVPRDQDDLAVDEGLLRVREDRDTVPLGHHKVCEDDIDVVLVDQVHRLGSGAGRVDVEIRAGKDVQKKREDIFVIFRNQQRFFHRGNFTLRGSGDGRSIFLGR